MFDYDWLTRKALSIGIELDNDKIDKFKKYEQLLRTENRKYNLVAGDSDRLIADHFLDSLSSFLCLSPKKGIRVADIGSGAGFPGIPINIAFADFELTLIESRKKRAQFLKDIVKELGLSQAQVCVSRVEDIGHDADFREKYDFVVARAVAELRVLLEYALPLLAPGGRLIALKGAKARVETDAANEALSKLGGKLAEIRDVDLIPGKVRYLIAVDKISPSPSQFPRRVGIPSKRPIK